MNALEVINSCIVSSDQSGVEYGSLRVYKDNGEERYYYIVTVEEEEG